VGLQQVIEQILSGLKVFTAHRAGFPVWSGWVDVGYVLLQVAHAAIHPAAFCAHWFRFGGVQVTSHRRSTAIPWNPTSLVSYTSQRAFFFFFFVLNNFI
jgi:hypothetical protein